MIRPRTSSHGSNIIYRFFAPLDSKFLHLALLFINGSNAENDKLKVALAHKYINAVGSSPRKKGRYMSVKKISHIGIAVPNIDQYLKVYRDTLGMEFVGTEEVAEQKVKVAFLQVGESRIELLEPTATDSPLQKYLSKNDNKPKFHHIALEVDDLKASLAQAAADGIQLIDETPKQGAGGAQIAFLHPRSTAGVLTELCQHTPHK